MGDPARAFWPLCPFLKTQTDGKLRRLLSGYVNPFENSLEIQDLVLIDLQGGSWKGVVSGVAKAVPLDSSPLWALHHNELLKKVEQLPPT